MTHDDAIAKAKVALLKAIEPPAHRYFDNTRQHVFPKMYSEMHTWTALRALIESGLILTFSRLAEHGLDLQDEPEKSTRNSR